MKSISKRLALLAFLPYLISANNSDGFRSDITGQLYSSSEVLAYQTGYITE